MPLYSEQSTGQWLSNCTKSRLGPRWLQAYNKILEGQFSPPEAASANLQEVLPTVGMPPDQTGVLYQGRAHSAKEIFSRTAPYKDAILERTTKLILEAGDGHSEGADIRHWRRALDELWTETSEVSRQTFIDQAAARSLRINR